MRPKRYLYYIYGNSDGIYGTSVRGTQSSAQTRCERQATNSNDSKKRATESNVPASKATKHSGEIDKPKVWQGPACQDVQEKLTTFDTFIDSPSRKKLSPAQRYGQSKLVSFAEPGVVLTVKDMFLS